MLRDPRQKPPSRYSTKSSRFRAELLGGVVDRCRAATFIGAYVLLRTSTLCTIDLASERRRVKLEPALVILSVGP